MTLYLIRHAHALDRAMWQVDDSLRPLSQEGERQAQALAVFLADRAPERVISSPALRCTQTMEPLATKLGLEVEIAPELGEGEGPAGVLALAESAPNAALCSHGDVIGEVIDLLAGRGMRIHGKTGNAKGSWWEIRTGPEGLQATYNPPP